MPRDMFVSRLFSTPAQGEVCSVGRAVTLSTPAQGEVCSVGRAVTLNQKLQVKLAI